MYQSFIEVLCYNFLITPGPQTLVMDFVDVAVQRLQEANNANDAVAIRRATRELLGCLRKAENNCDAKQIEKVVTSLLPYFVNDIDSTESVQLSWKVLLNYASSSNLVTGYAHACRNFNLVEKYFAHLHKQITEDKFRQKQYQYLLDNGQFPFLLGLTADIKTFLTKTVSHTDWKMRAVVPIVTSRLTNLFGDPNELFHLYRVLLFDVVPEVRMFAWSGLITEEIFIDFPEDILDIFMKTIFLTPEKGQDIMVEAYAYQHSFLSQDHIAMQLFRWDYVENHLGVISNDAIDKWVSLIVFCARGLENQEISEELKASFLALCENLNRELKTAIVSWKIFFVGFSLTYERNGCFVFY